jgi:hypothetical protein
MAGKANAQRLKHNREVEISALTSIVLLLVALQVRHLGWSVSGLLV